MTSSRIYKTALPGATIAASAVCVALLRPAAPGTIESGLPLTLVLATLASVAAGIAAAGGRGRPVRLSLAFVLAGFRVLPPLLAFLVALAALASGAGGGVAGPPRRGFGSAAAAAAGVAIAALLLAGASATAVPGSASALASILGFFLVAQVVSFIVAALLPGGNLADAADAGHAPSYRLLLFETVNVPLAWCLSALLADQAVALALALAAVVLGGELAVKALDRALADLTLTNDVLAARLSELATLHAIGREMLSSLDPARVFSVIERECSKILDVDELVVALAEPGTGEFRVAHRWIRGEPPGDAAPAAPDALSNWVALEKRPVRVGDLHEKPQALPFRTEGIPADIRSVLAAPLVVEERVTGVLSVRSARLDVYDEHQLAVLTTIAQQAAVAIENARHYEMATVDSLTRLYLRDYFHHRLEEEYHRARRYRGSFAVLMLDLDGFKEINDRHGHFHGDRYLRALGTAIRSRLRAADLACRYGGDEFCLLLPETDLKGARVIAERLRKTVSRLVTDVDGEAARTTASIGVAVFPQHDAGDLRGLLLKADQALYQAKRAGRDRVVPFAA